MTVLEFSCKQLVNHVQVELESRHMSAYERGKGERLPQSLLGSSAENPKPAVNLSS